MLKIHCDGGSRGNPGNAASAFVVLGEKGEVLVRCGEFVGVETNNVAEYSAVLFAMKWLLENKISDDVIFFMDSQLITNQLTGVYSIKVQKLATFAARIKQMEKEFPGKITYKNIPRAENKIADLLVNEVLDKNLPVKS